MVSLCLCFVSLAFKPPHKCFLLDVPLSVSSQPRCLNETPSPSPHLYLFQNSSVHPYKLFPYSWAFFLSFKRFSFTISLTPLTSFPFTLVPFKLMSSHQPTHLQGDRHPGQHWGYKDVQTLKGSRRTSDCRKG